MTGLAAAAGAILGAEPGTPDGAAVERELGPLLARMPAPARAGLHAGAAALGAAARATTGRRLDRLPPGEAQAVLERFAASPTLAPALDAIKALVVMAGGTAVSGVSAPAPESEPARPDAELDLLAAHEAPSVLTADAVVVGSGAGGAVAARTLARAGRSVLVVEEGRRHTVDEFRTRPALERFGAMYRDGGATVALGRPPVTLPLGRGVGGTTLVNSGTCFRPPAEVVERWRGDLGLALELEPALDEVWEMLQIAPSPDTVLGNNARLVLEGAAKLGWPAAPLQRNAPGCGGCCQCAIGCPRNAKLGVHLNALPDACAAGARIVTHARVERVLHDRGAATGVEIRRRDGALLRIDAPLVVVAAGATETPPLLRRSGLGGHPELGRNLALHPALSIGGRFAEPVTAWRGVLQSAGVEAFHEGEGILLEATATPPGLGSLALPGYGPPLRAALEDSAHLASLGAMVADAPAGRVLGRRRTLVTYALKPLDGARLLRAVELAGRVLLAAGAEEVLTGLPNAPRVRDERALREAVARADPKHLHVAAFHPTGTARAGADAKRCPVDAEGRLRGLRNVLVADASVLPTCPEVNPQVSIMAAAMAIASSA